MGRRRLVTKRRRERKESDGEELKKHRKNKGRNVLSVSGTWLKVYFWLWEHLCDKL